MIKKSVCAAVAITLVSVWPADLWAQAPPPLPLTGNPTPGTPQPDPPKLADRITLVGCVQRVETGPAAADSNTPSDSRYVLTSATREKRVPPGAGTSTVAAAATSPTYRLAALDSALSVFVGAKVEVSGAVEPSAVKSADDGAVNAPTLRVEFVQKLAPNCLP